MTGPVVKTVIVDTNLLLHFKRLDSLDWSKLDCDEVILIILPVVLRELEKVKALGGTPRLRERAGKVVTWFGTLVDEGMEVRLKQGVSLRFLTAEPDVDFDAYNLTREIQDDHLIAGLIALSGESGSAPLIATADIGVKVKAKQRRFAVHSPPNSDALADEPDSREKELAELRKENQLLKNRLPRLSVQAADGNTRILVPRRQDIPALPSLEDLQRKYPKWEVPPKSSTGYSPIPDMFLLGTSDSGRQRYNEELQEFYDEYKAFRAKHDDWVSGELCRLELPIFVVNEGTSLASDIDVVIEFQDGLAALTSDDVPEAPKPPRPPEKPKPGLMFGLQERYIQPFPHLARPLNLVPPDWSLVAEGCSAHFNLKKLKHGFERAIPGLVVQFPNRQAMRSMSFEVHISAAELPSAIEQTFHLVFE